MTKSNHKEPAARRESIVSSASLRRHSALEAAPRLLGHTLVRRTEDGEIRCRIIETESYGGVEDKGSHAYGGRNTARTEVMFGEGGIAYIYLIYGMYHCLNVVTGAKGDPQAVLIRAVEPLTAEDERRMALYRGRSYRKPADLSNGPGKLCRALRIDKSLNGVSFGDTEGPLYLEAGDPRQSFTVKAGIRINIPYAEEYAEAPWRFFIADHPYVSVKDKNAVDYEGLTDF
ncbi:DNA-3-methyladenine glycosylase [Paenibacillus sp. CAA11]|uniref:DNA-3-methyladenine glycosylase n=1 Tax=Paenibacillus sp. CAA11 TaxID=1532905 RepID=UPI000D392D78|nr:DNA-3-methyladenine glycosylase [Paenibacillus sp. CAA11]AWB42873.1 DNA-3-methyladenine glycosylase [Paenibacillus sp. CAA11]